MPPENDCNLHHLEDAGHLDAEGIVEQPLLRAASINHNGVEPLALEFAADGSNRPVIPGQIPEAMDERISTTTTTNNNNNSTPFLSESFAPFPREIDQASSTFLPLPHSLEGAAVEPATLSEIHRQGTFENSSPASSVMRDTSEDEEEKREIEEEKDEIPATFAVIPPAFSTEHATVLGEPARLFHDHHDDVDEYVDMAGWQQAQATAYGACGGDSSASAAASAANNNNDTNNRAGPQEGTELEPLEGENALDFYNRNRTFWTINAAESLVSQAAFVSVSGLKAQGMRLAEEYFNAAKNERAGVVVVPAASAAAAQRKDHEEQQQASRGQTTHQFELDPLPGETLENFSSRTLNFWTMQAAESLTLQDAPVGVDALNLESARLAQDYWAMNHQLVRDDHLNNHHDHSVISTKDAAAQEATIVEIEHDLHPLEMSHDAVRAEFVGQDFSPISSTHNTDSSREALAVQGLAVVDVGTSHQVDDMTTEATVIDSAPLTKEESHDAWRQAQEVQVLEDSDSPTPFLDRKPAAIDRAFIDQTEEFAVAEQEAEVLSIQEEFHPFEFIDEREAQAQVVGQDYNYESHGAVFANEYVSPAFLTTDTVIAAASAASEEGRTTEFHAVASPVRYTSNSDQTTEVQAVASQGATHEQRHALDVHGVVSPAAEHGSETQVHSVTSRSLSAEQEQIAEIHAVVVDQAPLTPTATAVAVTSNPFADDPNDTPAMSRDGLAALDAQYDDSWMRAPSLASQDLPPVAVLAPPDQQSAWCLEDVSNSTHGEEFPPPRSSSGGVDEDFDASMRASSTSLGSEPTHSHRRNQLHNLSGNLARGLSVTGNVMEVLFGETKASFVGRKTRASQDEISGAVLPRSLLPWTVIYSDASRLWVVTIQCSQKALDHNHNKTEASKALRAFSLPTEKQAMCLGLAWTPPRMLPFEDNPLCHICGFRFAVFRRACHCRNCGVCICKDCTVQWPAKMVPDTYNAKKASAINICRSCDWLCNAFRLALLNGNRDEAVALHATGNINLTSPFNNVKGEMFYPVHAAALGGSLELLRWLVDDHCCPIKSVRLSGLNSTSSDRYTPIVTSKGRSLLGIAMANGNVHMVRYLVVIKHLSIEAEKDITPAMVLRNFERVLWLLPDTVGSDSAEGPPDVAVSPERPAFAALVAGNYTDMSPIPPSAPISPDERTLSQEARDFGAILQHRPIVGDDENNGGENHDDEECIICYDAKIDCVATPCGHQMCCLKCSTNFKPPKCPVCAQECSFLRVFR